MRASIAAVAAAAALASGCAAFASGNAKHSGITPCVSNPVYGIVDLAIAGGGAGALLATGALDHSMWWLVIPGVFATSGVVGIISAQRCASTGRGDGGSTPTYKDPPSYALPPAEQMPIAAPPAPPPAEPRVVQPADAQPVEVKPRDEPPAEPQNAACTRNEDCPRDHTCLQLTGARGSCVPLSR